MDYQLGGDFQKTIHDLFAPEVFQVQIALALTRAERQGRIAASQAALWADVLSARLQVERRPGQHELMEAPASRLRFPARGGVQRLGDAPVELAAHFAPLRPNRRFRQAVEQLLDVPAG